jgi:hypothetical protein
MVRFLLCCRGQDDDVAECTPADVSALRGCPQAAAMVDQSTGLTKGEVCCQKSGVSPRRGASHRRLPKSPSGVCLCADPRPLKHPSQSDSDVPANSMLRNKEFRRVLFLRRNIQPRTALVDTGDAEPLASTSNSSTESGSSWSSSSRASGGSGISRTSSSSVRTGISRTSGSTQWIWGMDMNRSKELNSPTRVCQNVVFFSPRLVVLERSYI